MGDRRSFIATITSSHLCSFNKNHLFYAIDNLVLYNANIFANIRIARCGKI